MQSILDHDRRGFAIALGLTALVAVSEGVGLFLLLPILQIASDTPSGVGAWVADRLSDLGASTTSAQVAVLIGGFLVLLVLRNLVSWARTVHVAKFTQIYVDTWRDRAFRAIAKSEWIDLIRYDRNEGQHALLQDVLRLSAGTTFALQILVNVVLISVQLCVAALISPALTTAILGFGALGALALPFVLRRSWGLGKRQTLAGQKTHETLMQFFAALKLIKVQRDEDAYLARYAARVGDLRGQILGFVRTQATVQAVFQIAVACLVSGAVLVSLFVLEVPVLTLIAVVVIITRIGGPMLATVRAAQQFANLLPAYEKIDKLVANGPVDPPQTQMHALHDRGPMGVAFDQVTFRYAPDAGQSFGPMSFDIRAGQMVALVGPSGTGKTTTLDLMTGLLQPQSGRVLVDGADLSDPGCRAQTPKRVAYLTQDPLLIDDSLRSNLQWGNSTLPDAALNAALDKVGALALINSQPDGLDTQLGHGGQRFSGGERQRLCLARALLRDPDLLILDEATSALDQRSERAILQIIADLRQTMTVVIVTHRSLNSDDFDQVIDLQALTSA